METALTLVLLFPLAGVFFGLVFGRRLPEKVVGWIASLFIGAAFVCSVVSFFGLRASGHDSLRVVLYEWIGAGAVKIDAALWLDPLSAVMILTVSGVAFLIHVYSIGYMHGDRGYGRYFTWLNLFTFAMLLLVLGDSLALLFIGWEGVGLCSYLLIGFWFERETAAEAGQKAFIVNRIGDACFIAGLLLLFAIFGTLNIREILDQAPGVLVAGGGTVTLITLLLFAGATGKSAQLPLHIWLPDAMEGPTPVSALIHAATMVTAGVYLVARLGGLYLMAPVSLTVIALVGVVTSLMAGSIAIAQTDIKRVLAYSTISQLGYMFLALGAGAFAVGIFHLMTHAFFKALLFMAAGSVIHAMSDRQDMRDMGGLKRHLPITHLTMLAGGLALAGIPIFSGFFSKDEILFEAWFGPHGSPLYWVLGALAAVLTGLYTFRLLYLTFYGESRVPDGVHPHESPRVMTVPLLILAFLATFGGFLGLPHVLGGGAWIQDFITSAIVPAAGAAHGVAGSTGQALAETAGHAAEAGGHGHAGAQILLMIVSVGLALTGFWFARRWYGRTQPFPEVPEQAVPGLWRILRQKYMVDEFYFLIVGRPLHNISKWLYRAVDVVIIDGLVRGTGGVTTALSRLIRRLQTGYIGIYAFCIAAGAIVLLAVLLL